MKFIRKIMKEHRLTIPKPIVQLLELKEYAILTVEEDKIIIQPVEVH